MGRCDESNYLAWLNPCSKSLTDHSLYAIIGVVLWGSCVCYFAIPSMCNAKHGHFHQVLFSYVLCGSVTEDLWFVNILALLAVTVWYWLLFSFGMLLFTYEIGWCWLFLQLRTSFEMSRKSFSRVGRNLSHLNCTGSIWLLYLLLMHVPSFFTSFIRIPWICLMFAGSAKSKLLTWLYIAILTLPKYSASASCFLVWYVESLISVNATWTQLLHFWLVLCGSKLIELLDIFAILLLRLNRNLWSLFVQYTVL